MRPQLTQANVPHNVAGFVQGKQRHIRFEVDQRYRRGLREGAASEAGPKAKRLIVQSLQNGPSRGGIVETQKFFGKDLMVKLRMTAQIVDALEISMPGFKKWLELTGFGNDKTMIRGFVAWAEHKTGMGKVMTRLADV